MNTWAKTRFGVILTIALGLGLGACASGGGETSDNSGGAAETQAANDALPSATNTVEDTQAAQAFAQTYTLGPGDRLRVIVFGEEDLSGEFEVDSAGIVSLPLIRPIKTQGKTLTHFKSEVETQLSAGYLVDPRVSVEILNYRPFYITGEVGRPGEYPYVAGMNVLKAIAMAGGYTYRANTRRVFLTRAGTNAEETKKPGQELMILPGDYIRVPERFF